jgi:hypothetical protein
MTQITVNRVFVSSLVVLSLAAPAAAQQAAPAQAGAGQPTPVRFAIERPIVAEPQALPAVRDWQQQLDAARARRSHGRKIQFGGLALTVGGLVVNSIALSAAENCYRSCSPGAPFLGLSLIVGGAVTSLVGGVQAHDADSEVSALLVRGPGRIPVISMPIGDHGALSVSAGRDKAIAYRVSW